MHWSSSQICPRKEKREEYLCCSHGKVGKLTDWFSLHQVWPSILGAHCWTLRAWLHDPLSTPPSPPWMVRFIWSSWYNHSWFQNWLYQDLSSSFRWCVSKFGSTCPILHPLPPKIINYLALDIIKLPSGHLQNAHISVVLSPQLPVLISTSTCLLALSHSCGFSSRASF